MLEITADDIALLSDTHLRTLIGLLCEAELRLRGLSRLFSPSGLPHVQPTIPPATEGITLYLVLLRFPEGFLLLGVIPAHSFEGSVRVYQPTLSRDPAPSFPSARDPNSSFRSCCFPGGCAKRRTYSDHQLTLRDAANFHLIDLTYLQP